MKTQPQICKQFDEAVIRLASMGITVASDGAFALVAKDTTIATTDSVDGLTGFADGVSYARGMQ